MKITDRTILITGGSAGIGLAFALKFLELGNQVIVTGRRQTVLHEVKAKYPKLHTIQGDVADPVQIALNREELRSEEHTSELQSHSDLVCRLQLEKINSAT